MAKTRDSDSPASDGLSDALSAVWTSAASLADLARDGVRAAREQAGRAAEDAARSIGDEAVRMVDERKGRAAERLERVASAAHQTANVLRAAKLSVAGDYLEQGASAIDGVTGYLEDGDVRQMIDDATDLARRYPALAAAGVIVAGLAVGRFLAAGRAAQLGAAAGAAAASAGTTALAVSGKSNKRRGSKGKKD